MRATGQDNYFTLLGCVQEKQWNTICACSLETEVVTKLHNIGIQIRREVIICLIANRCGYLISDRNRECLQLFITWSIFLTLFHASNRAAAARSMSASVVPWPMDSRIAPRARCGVTPIAPRTPLTVLPSSWQADPTDAATVSAASVSSSRPSTSGSEILSVLGRRCCGCPFKVITNLIRVFLALDLEV